MPPPQRLSLYHERGVAMSAAWPTLRQTDRELALALLFASGQTRDILADRLTLAHECEAAIRVASEPMLAAIRLQWWVEAVETGRHEGVPLMLRLSGRIADGTLDAAELTEQIGLWQDRLATAPEDAGSCWAACFAMLAPNHAEAARTIAHCLFADGPPPDNVMIEGCGGSQMRWLWMLAKLCRHRQKHTEGEDSLLVWRMLGWRIFG